jgi:hypothetical protein
MNKRLARGVGPASSDTNSGKKGIIYSKIMKKGEAGNHG